MRAPPRSPCLLLALPSPKHHSQTEALRHRRRGGRACGDGGGSTHTHTHTKESQREKCFSFALTPSPSAPCLAPPLSLCTQGGACVRAQADCRHPLSAPPLRPPRPLSMGRRHSKNAGATGSEALSYHERRALGYGTATERLGKVRRRERPWTLGSPPPPPPFRSTPHSQTAPPLSSPRTRSATTTTAA